MLGVILLFLGVTIAPSINANAVEDDLVELEVEFCGIGNKHSVKLTQQEVDEIEVLFNDIRRSMKDIENKKEAENLFIKSLTKLVKYDIITALELTTLKKAVGSLDTTYLITGQIDHCEFWRPIYKYLADVLGDWPCIFSNLLMLVWELNIISPGIISDVSFGTHNWDNWPIHNEKQKSGFHEPSNGWVKVSKNDEIKEWNGSFFGNLKTMTTGGYMGLFHTVFIGATGFIGIRINLKGFNEWAILGFVKEVNLRYE